MGENRGSLEKQVNIDFVNFYIKFYYLHFKVDILNYSK